MEYTGFRQILKHLFKLWEIRKDFDLLVTNPSRFDLSNALKDKYPFLTVKHFSREEYVKVLWNSDIVIASHNGSNFWSLALIEAICCNCIPLVKKRAFLPELISIPFNENLPDNKYFYTGKDFCSKLNYLLNNLEKEKKEAEDLFTKFRNFYSWENRINEWINLFERIASDGNRFCYKTNVLKKIDDIMDKEKIVTKKKLLNHLNWHGKSRYISWTQYRNYLKENYSEIINCPEAVYYITEIKSLLKRKGLLP